MSSTAKILRHPANLRRAFESSLMHPALASWVGGAIPPDVDIRAGLRALRARSRDAAQNDDHMAYYLRLVETNVIGRAGITIQARPKLSGGGYDKATAARIEAEWDRQCERGTWDCSGQLSRTAFARLGVRTCAMDGEVLVRVQEGDPESPTGFSVELIDPEALDIDYNGETASGNRVVMGVEMTRRRRPVAYWLFSEPDSRNGYGTSYANARRFRVPASEIIHCYLPEWVWGSRGIPWAHTALRRMKMLGGYEEAAITAARAAALKSAVYVANDLAIGTQPAGQQQDGIFVQELQPGSAEQLPLGWDLKTIDWQWPNTEHGVFVREALRGIASGLGVSYNALANDLTGVNYSSLRQGALTERDLWTGVQDWWIDWVERPLYRRWVAHAIRSGLVTRGNGSSLPLDRIPELSHATFQGRRWPWVDPLKDIQAAREAVALGVRSISDIIRESGRDPEEVWLELAEDRAMLAKLGIPVASDTSPAAGQEEPTNAAD
jgi:lambda family phage portal protein